MKPDPIKDIIDERGKVYGDPSLSHHNIGLSWTGLIQQHYGLKLDHPLPDFLVELMMVSFKVHRASRVYHADNYVDMAAYARFAENDQKPRDLRDSLTRMSFTKITAKDL